MANETPLQRASNLSTKFGVNIMLKREDMQPVFSFKLRGAYNKIVNLSAAERERGIIAVSAGNHAQGVAFAAKKLGISAVIVMPTCTPSIKYQNVEKLGAKVILHGNDFDEAKLECKRLIAEHNFIDIPPYDDPYVIAGQGTIAIEIMRQFQRWDAAQQQSLCSSSRNIDAVFVAVGGGGLIAGITAYIKRIHPNVKVIGVEAVDANAMYLSLQQGKRVTLDKVGLFADGAAVKMVGKETFRIARGDDDVDGVDEIVLVDNDEICAAIKDVFNDTRTVMEPAGALGVAGLKSWLGENNVTTGNYIAVTCGANMNFDRLRFVAERASLGERREALISVVIPERPGSFMRLYEVIHPRSVTEFCYRYGHADEAHVLMSFEVENMRAEVDEIALTLGERGMRCMDLSANDIAKYHARYMIGGMQVVPNERIFQFTFPERPGALQKFLKGLKFDWNVSMFHYRNYGADVGKVLVGIQVPEQDTNLLNTFLQDLDYPYTEETFNPLYTTLYRHSSK